MAILKTRTFDGTVVECRELICCRRPRGRRRSCDRNAPTNEPFTIDDFSTQVDAAGAVAGLTRGLPSANSEQNLDKVMHRAAKAVEPPNSQRVSTHIDWAFYASLAACSMSSVRGIPC
jgi:hypothetical protein